MFYLEKIQTKQGFTAVDMLMCIAAIIAVGFLTVPILVKRSSQHTQNEAMYRAHNLSISLARKIRSQSQNSFARGLASSAEKNISHEGIVGTDPWGNPYHYRVLKDIYGQPTHLVVWSWGSNSAQDTGEHEFKTHQGKVHFNGDDLGYIIRLGSSNS